MAGQSNGRNRARGAAPAHPQANRTCRLHPTVIATSVRAHPAARVAGLLGTAQVLRGRGPCSNGAGSAPQPAAPGQIDRSRLGQTSAMAEATAQYHPAFRALRLKHEQGAGRVRRVRRMASSRATGAALPLPEICKANTRPLAPAREPAIAGRPAGLLLLEQRRPRKKGCGSAERGADGRRSDPPLPAPPGAAAMATDDGLHPRRHPVSDADNWWVAWPRLPDLRPSFRRGGVYTALTVVVEAEQLWPHRLAQQLHMTGIAVDLAPGVLEVIAIDAGDGCWPGWCAPERSEPATPLSVSRHRSHGEPPLPGSAPQHLLHQGPASIGIPLQAEGPWQPPRASIRASVETGPRGSAPSGVCSTGSTVLARVRSRAP